MKITSRSWYLWAFLVALLTVAAVEAAPLPVSTQFFYGDVKFTSLDGRTSYFETVSLIRRVVNPAQSKITEFVLQPARLSGRGPVEYKTNIVRSSPTSSVFNVSDDGGTFSGTMTFSGPEWKWENWTYEIEITAGGGIRGKGSLSTRGIQTQKYLLDKGKNPISMLLEKLAPISEERYLALRKQMGATP